ncbi:hypothetical protein B7C62_23180 [Kitasatospora albolonga]|uniref:Secreted protein n=1 Tax=Kitasatospora albolonga TaxID=68173 RepID=A0ABC8BX79_9ACTN|nr:hypothetical protein B7C62_23180 [Kitasatospora albolonga]
MYSPSRSGISPGPEYFIVFRTFHLDGFAAAVVVVSWAACADACADAPDACAGVAPASIAATARQAAAVLMFLMKTLPVIVPRALPGGAGGRTITLWRV